MSCFYAQLAIRPCRKHIKYKNLKTLIEFKNLLKNFNL